MGDGRAVLAGPRGVREVEPGSFRRPLAHADADRPRRARLPHPDHARAGGLHRPAAPRHPQRAAHLSGRGPLGGEARPQPALAPDRARLDGALAGPAALAWTGRWTAFLADALPRRRLRP